VIFVHCVWNLEIWPGQAISFQVGMLKILELRRRAMAQ